MDANPAAFEEIEHTADWALIVRGATFAALLENAAFGMLHLLGASPSGDERRWRDIELRANDPESLLVTWLEELLYGIETEGMTYTGFDVEISDGPALVARIKIAPSIPLRKHIKAVTFHELSIEKTPEGYETVVVFDV